MREDMGDRLAAVRMKFVTGIKERAAKLEVLLAMPDSNEKHDELQALVHKIAGSAGFYGEQDIADAAAKIDVSLQSIADAKQLDRLTGALNDLHAMLTAL